MSDRTGQRWMETATEGGIETNQALFMWANPGQAQFAPFENPIGSTTDAIGDLIAVEPPPRDDEDIDSEGTVTEDEDDLPTRKLRKTELKKIAKSTAECEQQNTKATYKTIMNRFFVSSGAWEH